MGEMGGREDGDSAPRLLRVRWFRNGLLRLLPLLLVLAQFALLPQAAAQNTTRFTHIAAGFLHSVALKADGTVVAWGWNDSGQGTVPAGLTGVVAVAAGSEHNLALKADGTVVAWGANHGGQSSVPRGNGVHLRALYATS